MLQLLNKLSAFWGCKIFFISLALCSNWWTFGTILNISTTKSLTWLSNNLFLSELQTYNTTQGINIKGINFSKPTNLVCFYFYDNLITTIKISLINQTCFLLSKIQCLLYFSPIEKQVKVIVNEPNLYSFTQKIFPSDNDVIVVIANDIPWQKTRSWQLDFVMHIHECESTFLLGVVKEN